MLAAAGVVNENGDLKLTSCFVANVVVLSHIYLGY
jgi:hypothetical protein